MFWITKDGTLRFVECVSEINTLDRWIVMMCTEKEALEHRLRDDVIEYGLKHTWNKIQSGLSVLMVIANDKVNQDVKYKAFGLWVMGELDSIENKENGNGGNTVEVREKPAEAERKRRAYCT